MYSLMDFDKLFTHTHRIKQSIEPFHLLEVHTYPPLTTTNLLSLQIWVFILLKNSRDISYCADAGGVQWCSALVCLKMPILPSFQKDISSWIQNSRPGVSWYQNFKNASLSSGLKLRWSVLSLFTHMLWIFFPSR